MKSGTPRRFILCLTLVWVTALAEPELVNAGIDNTPDEARAALVRLSVDYIDSILGGVAASTGAVASEFVLASNSVPPFGERQREYWRTHYRARGQTMQFQSWYGAPDSPPPYQSENPGIFSYGGEELTDRTFKTLEVFRNLTPVVRAAYRSYPYSWSYVTTADGMMLIYPFLTLEEAVNNDLPTQQAYYTHADFEHRKVGWTPPYLDLVGAGMMVTASTPAYDGDTLLGVVSHDITLAQLSQAVLGALARDVSGTAWLVDRSGLVIAVSDASLAKELDEVNQSAGEAVLHYRTPAELKKAAGEKATASTTPWINQLTEDMLTHAKSTPSDEVIHSEDDGHAVLGGRVKATGWLLIWKAADN